VACLAGGFMLSFSLRAQEALEFPQEALEFPAEQSGDIDFAAPDTSELANEDPSLSAKDYRVTLAHEASTGHHSVVNNRSWFRVEYSKFFLNSFFVQVDSKVNAYWSRDHRAVAEDKSALFDTNTPEAFLQYSADGGRTSVKLGQQRLIWGESEAGAITDEVSPRDFSELFFIPLEESRRGQLMAVVDHFASSGDWTGFFVPDAKFNRYADPRTSYYIDPFAGGVDVRDDSDQQHHEYGMRWKRAFSNSDISVMAADLIDNDYAYRQDGTSSDGRLSIARLQQRFTMIGGAFSYAKGKFLFKGEVAYKSPKAFNDASFRIIEKDVLDSALGVTYSLGESNTIGVEIVNRYVNDWRHEIVGIPRNTNSLVLNMNLYFLNENLLVNWLTIYERPYTSYQSSLRTSYEWSDNVISSIDLHLVDVPSGQSALHPYRDKDQIVLRLQYQF
jgi:hypothetical protein